MLKLVAFDLDGTLADTLPLCIRAFQEGVSPHAGHALAVEEITALFGLNEEGMIQKLAPDHLTQALDDYYAAYTRLHRLCERPFPGVASLIADLKKQGLTVCMITGKADKSCWISLKRFGMEQAFDAVLTGSPLGNNKKERLLELMRSRGLKADECLYVGDAVADVLACRAAGVACLSAAWFASADAQALETVNPGMVFSNVADAKAHIFRLLSGF